jgi:hypothetical protein
LLRNQYVSTFLSLASLVTLRPAAKKLWKTRVTMFALSKISTKLRKTTERVRMPMRNSNSRRLMMARTMLQAMLTPKILSMGLRLDLETLTLMRSQEESSKTNLRRLISALKGPWRTGRRT